MDTKSPKFTASSVAFEPLVKKGVVYIAIKGSLHASDCSVFGLEEEELKHLANKYEPAVNGYLINTNVLLAINSLSKLGYRIISSTGESEITWTMHKQ